MMRKNKKIMLLLLSTTAVSGYSMGASAASWRLTPSLMLTETYTDNVDLDSASQQSDFVTQITPGISVTGEGARLNMSVNYAGNYFYYPGDDTDKHDLRHNLQASLSSELIDEFFFIDSTANINQQFVDRRRAISSESTSRTDNRRTVQTYRVAPYVMHRFGPWATAQLRYDFRHIRTAADPIQTSPDTLFGNSLSHQASASLTSGRYFSRFRWTLSAEYRTEERENGTDYDTTITRADGSYQLTDMLSLLGSVGYQKRDALGSFSNFDGFIWDAGFRLVPGPRTSISFRFGNQNDGDTYSLSAQYQITPKNVINLSYTDTIRTFQDFAFDDNSDNFDPLGNSDFISGDISRRKRWMLSLSGTRGRTSYSLSAFYNKYRGDSAALDEKRYGGAVSVSRNLNTRMSVDGSFSYNLSRFSTTNSDDKFWSASANMRYRISQSLIGTLGFVHADRNQQQAGILNGGSNYISLSIRVEI